MRMFSSTVGCIVDCIAGCRVMATIGIIRGFRLLLGFEICGIVGI